MKTSLNSKDLGHYIRAHRMELNLTQSYLAERLGMSAQFLGRIEKGEVDIPKKSLEILFEKFSLNREEVFGIYIKAVGIKLLKSLGPYQ